MSVVEIPLDSEPVEPEVVSEKEINSEEIPENDTSVDPKQQYILKLRNLHG